MQHTKDRTPIINQSLLVYEFTCPDCGANFVGKTKRTLFERCAEHAWSDQNSIAKSHLDQCVEVQYLLNITSLRSPLFSNDNNIVRADNRNPGINLFIGNTNIIDRHKSFNILLFKEAMKINDSKPTPKHKIHYPLKWIQLNGNVKIGYCIIKNWTNFSCLI